MLGDYDPTQIPTLEGFPEDVFFVHEAGYHRPDGGFTPFPPVEEHHGSEPQGLPPVSTEGIPHPRFWDVHIFLDPNGGIPRTGITSPFDSIPGFPSDDAAFFFPEIPFGATPRPFDERIEAEDFDHAEGFGFRDNTIGNFSGEYRLTDVDINPSATASNGFAVVNIEAGEFLQYTVDVDQSGLFRLGLQMGGVFASGGVFHIEVDGDDVSGPLSIPALGQDFLHFCPDVELDLGAGEHQIRLVFDQNNLPGRIGELDYLELIEFENPVRLEVQGQTTPTQRPVNDRFTLIRNPVDPEILDIFLNVSPGSIIPPVASAHLCDIEQIDILGLGGDDTLVIDNSNGPVVFPGTINFDGGTGTNEIEIDDQSITVSNEYSIGLTQLSSSSFATIELSGVNSLVFDAGSQADIFNVDRLESSTSLTINGNEGSDTFHVGNR